MNNIDNKSIALDLCNKHSYGLGFDYLAFYVANKYKLHFFPFCEFVVSVQSSITEQQLEIIHKIGRRMYEQRFPLGNLLISIVEQGNLDAVMRAFFEKGYNKCKLIKWMKNIKRWPLFDDKDLMKIDEFCGLYIEYYREKHNIILDENKKARDNVKMEDSVKLVKDFLNSKYLTIEQYCKEYEISPKTFERTLLFLDANQHPIVKEYENRVKQGKTMDFVKIAKLVANDIKNGISLANGEKREFDLLDYYERIIVPLDEFLYKTNSKLSALEKKTIISFILKYRKDIPIGDLDLIYNMKQIVGVKFDEQGNMIPSSGKEITREEKDYIINYLKNNNIPLTNATYNTAVRRLANGILTVDEIELSDKKKKKVKTKKK